MNANALGLPEGIQLVRIGVAKPDEFELTNDPSNEAPPFITKGPRAGSQTQVIVKPAAGHSFEFNIRTLRFDLVQNLPEPVEIAMTFKFHATTRQVKDLIESRLAALKELPGFVEAK